MLHFGAVDYGATVWVNGVKAIEHEGGYTPFQIEIQELLVNGPEQQIVVRAEDDPGDLEKPRGKQDWKLEAHSIWYPRTTGIWQTVWMEVLPAAYISTVRWTGNLMRWEIGLAVHTRGALPVGSELAVTMKVAGQLLAQDRYGFVTKASGAGSFSAGELHRSIALSDRGSMTFATNCFGVPGIPRSSISNCSCWMETGQFSTRSRATRRSVPSRSRATGLY